MESRDLLYDLIFTEKHDSVSVSAQSPVIPELVITVHNLMKEIDELIISAENKMDTLESKIKDAL